jgi:hypothetical protein
LYVEYQDAELPILEKVKTLSEGSWKNVRRRTFASGPGGVLKTLR